MNIEQVNLPASAAGKPTTKWALEIGKLDDGDGCVRVADKMSGPAAGSHATVGNMIYGSKGYLSSANGFETFLGKEQQPGPKAEVAEERGNNWANFIQAVRSRNHSDLNAPVEEAVPSVVLIHLANISYRLGRSLHFDANTMRCSGDDEANRMFTRDYRAPFMVPKLADTTG